MINMNKLWAPLELFDLHDLPSRGFEGMMQFLFFSSPSNLTRRLSLMYTKRCNFRHFIQGGCAKLQQDFYDNFNSVALLLLPRTFFANFWTFWNVIFATKEAESRDITSLLPLQHNVWKSPIMSQIVQKWMALVVSVIFVNWEGSKLCGARGCVTDLTKWVPGYFCKVRLFCGDFQTLCPTKNLECQNKPQFVGIFLNFTQCPKRQKRKSCWHSHQNLLEKGFVIVPFKRLKQTSWRKGVQRTSGISGSACESRCKTWLKCLQSEN